MTTLGTAAVSAVPFTLLLIGLGLAVLTDTYTNRLHKKILLLIMVLATTLIAQNVADYLLAYTPHTVLRTVASIYGYSMRPADLAMLDINVPETDGIVLAVLIKLTNMVVPICFTVDGGGVYGDGEEPYR